MKTIRSPYGISAIGPKAKFKGDKQNAQRRMHTLVSRTTGDLVVYLFMDIRTEKLQLVKRLLDTDDETVLQQVKDIFENSEKDFWSDLPEHVKIGIERSRKQAEAGLLTSHEEVMKKYAKYL